MDPSKSRTRSKNNLALSGWGNYDSMSCMKILESQQSETDTGSLEPRDHAFFMEQALAEARKALASGEVPIGAVLVRDGQIIGRGCNQVETAKDPTAHAEILAIREASSKVGGWRIPDATLYVTMEPCSMCAGAIVLARIQKLVIGVMDPKAGACGSLSNIPQDPRLNHYAEIESGVLQEACSQIIKEFFQSLRIRNKDRKAIAKQNERNEI